MDESLGFLDAEFAACEAAALRVSRGVDSTAVRFRAALNDFSGTWLRDDAIARRLESSEGSSALKRFRGDLHALVLSFADAVLSDTNDDCALTSSHCGAFQPVWESCAATLVKRAPSNSGRQSCDAHLLESDCRDSAMVLVVVADVSCVLDMIAAQSTCREHLKMLRMSVDESVKAAMDRFTAALQTVSGFMPTVTLLFPTRLLTYCSQAARAAVILRATSAQKTRADDPSSVSCVNCSQHIMRAIHDATLSFASRFVLEVAFPAFLSIDWSSLSKLFNGAGAHPSVTFTFTYVVKFLLNVDEDANSAEHSARNECVDWCVVHVIHEAVCVLHATVLQSASASTERFSVLLRDVLYAVQLFRMLRGCVIASTYNAVATAPMLALLTALQSRTVERQKGGDGGESTAAEGTSPRANGEHNQRTTSNDELWTLLWDPEPLNMLALRRSTLAELYPYRKSFPQYETHVARVEEIAQRFRELSIPTACT